jgi:uncharacterized protein (UPF0332 family)
MISQKEIVIIKKKFNRLIADGKVVKPKAHKKEFFKNKAEDSLRLAKDLLEKKEHLDWALSTAYYSMFYNAISLLAHNGVDLQEIDESVHSLTYQALIYYFFILNSRIEEQYLQDFKSSMEESDIRLKTLAKQKSEELLAGYKNIKADRGKVTYELGMKAEINSAKSAVQRAEEFDVLIEKLMM